MLDLASQTLNWIARASAERAARFIFTPRTVVVA
jgi:hypothetical protein